MLSLTVYGGTHELALRPFGNELPRHGAAAHKRLPAGLGTEEGFTFKVIAKHLGISPNTVRRSRLLYEHAGVEALTRSLRSAGWEPVD